MLRFLPLTALALGTAVSTAVSPADRDLQCKNLTLPVDITSTVRQFPSNFNISNVNLTAVLDHPPTTVSGDWKIAASYCEPATHDSRREDTLQILLHGAVSITSFQFPRQMSNNGWCSSTQEPTGRD